MTEPPATQRIRPRERDAILQSLRAGVVPGVGLHLIQVGRAAEVKAMIDEFLEQDQATQQQTTTTQQQQPPTLAPRAMVVADSRTNSLIVSAGPRDLVEIGALVTRIDSPAGAAVDQVRVFPLKNAVASELADVLRSAIVATYPATVCSRCRVW